MLTVRRLLALGVVATTVTYVAVVASNASAADVIIAFPPTATPKGRLELTSTSSTVTVSWYDKDSKLVQLPITVTRSSKCLIDSTALQPLQPLLEISPTAGGATQALGYVSNGLGTRDNNTCNTANGTFGDTETIDLTLGATLRNQNIVVDWARLDLEGKFGTSLESTTRFTIGGAAKTVPVPSPWLTTDNGSDSGPSDNRDVDIGTSATTDNFVTLSIRPISADNRGQISLESGGDYPSAEASKHYTTLWLVQQTKATSTPSLVANSSARPPGAPGRVPTSALSPPHRPRSTRLAERSRVTTPRRDATRSGQTSAAAMGASCSEKRQPTSTSSSKIPESDSKSCGSCRPASSLPAAIRSSAPSTSTES